jgi:hypothetical protein
MVALNAMAANGIDSALESGESETTGVRLLTLLGHQRTLYRRLGVLAERQRCLVVSDDPQALLELLAERQLLVDGLTGLSAKLAPYRSNWTSIYGTLDEAARRQVSELLEEANTMLGAILQSDGQDCGTLSVRRQAMSQRLSESSCASQASAAYAASAGPGRIELTNTQG